MQDKFKEYWETNKEKLSQCTPETIAKNAFFTALELSIDTQLNFMQHPIGHD